MGKVFIYGAIGYEVDSKAIISEIEQSKDSLEVYINSPGGDVYEGFAIYNALQRKQDILSTYIDGLAYSAASWLALSAKKDKRYMSKAAQFGIHRASNFAGGNQKDLEKQIESLNKIDEIQIDIYTQATGLNPALIEEVMDNDTPLNFSEAQAFGFQLYEPEKVQAIFNFNNNMDILQKLKDLGMAAKSDPEKEVIAEAKEEVKAEIKKTDDPKELLKAELVNKAEYLAYRKNMEAFIDGVLSYIKEMPTIEEIEKAVKAKSDERFSALLKFIKSEEEVPKSEEAMLQKQMEAEQAPDPSKGFAPDKDAFKSIFETQKQQ
jgi:ATP-dependent protease ClpP protease subunit